MLLFYALNKIKPQSFKVGTKRTTHIEGRVKGSENQSPLHKLRFFFSLNKLGSVVLNLLMKVAGFC